MMPPGRLIGIGVFVAAGISLFAFGLFMIGERRLMFAEQFEVSAEFAEVSALQNGAVVRVRGMHAGEVTAIAVPPSPSGKFKVRMRIREDLRQLVRTDSVASIQTDGIVGNRFVQVQAGSERGAVVAHGGVIASREPFEFADLLERGSETIENVNTTIVQLQADLGKLLGTVADTARNTNDMISTVSADVEAISSVGRRMFDDTSRIVEGIRAGRGTVGRLVNDDELYNRAVSIARQAEEAVRLTREAAGAARAAVANLQGGLSSGDGPMQSIVADLQRTTASTRDAMSDLAENSEALKRNFLVRGYFQDRGYYDLNELTAADYRQGALAGRHRQPIRIWLRADVLFEPSSESQDAATKRDGRFASSETLSADGRVRLDMAMTEVLRYPLSTPLIIEGYAEGATRDVRFLRAADRARQVRDYLMLRYGLSPNHLGVMPLGDQAEGSPRGREWDGIGLAIWVDRRVLKASQGQ
jgi:phospholipid/cholesterol/gamma-HCH transport system substrate-binding protein